MKFSKIDMSSVFSTLQVFVGSGSICGMSWIVPTPLGRRMTFRASDDIEWTYQWWQPMVTANGSQQSWIWFISFSRNLPDLFFRSCQKKRNRNLPWPQYTFHQSFMSELHRQELWWLENDKNRLNQEVDSVGQIVSENNKIFNHKWNNIRLAKHQ